MYRTASICAALLLCSGWSARAECTKDTDCAGDQVCESGRCVGPSQPKAPAAPAPAKARTPSTTHYAVTVNLAETLLVSAFRVFELEPRFEYALGDDSVVHGGPGFAIGPAGGQFNLRGGLRYYVTDTQPIGFWAGFDLLLGIPVASSSPVTSFVFYGEGGYTFALGDRFTFELGLGLGEGIFVRPTGTTFLPQLHLTASPGFRF